MLVIWASTFRGEGGDFQARCEGFARGGFAKEFGAFGKCFCEVVVDLFGDFVSGVFGEDQPV
jgi:hypothetical protein